MKMFALAAALAVALPAAAHAADAPKAPAGEAPAKAEKCCCEEMMKRHHGDHQGMKHDMSGHQGHDMHGDHQPQPR